MRLHGLGKLPPGISAIGKYGLRTEHLILPDYGMDISHAGLSRPRPDDSTCRISNNLGGSVSVPDKNQPERKIVIESGNKTHDHVFTACWLLNLHAAGSVISTLPDWRFPSTGSAFLLPQRRVSATT
jgi:hypothetical protein